MKNVDLLEVQKDEVLNLVKQLTDEIDSLKLMKNDVTKLTSKFKANNEVQGGMISAYKKNTEELNKTIKGVKVDIQKANLQLAKANLFYEKEYIPLKILLIIKLLV